VSSLSNVWFINATKKLLEGSFKYPEKIRMFIYKPNNRKIPLSITNARIKVIEQALFNALEPQFEGYYVWENISKKIYHLESKKNKNYSNYKMVVDKNCDLQYFKKNIICPTLFCPENYGFRPNKSAHQALKAITR
jgi:retron-type reverse transcriptase